HGGRSHHKGHEGTQREFFADVVWRDVMFFGGHDMAQTSIEIRTLPESSLAVGSLGPRTVTLDRAKDAGGMAWASTVANSCCSPLAGATATTFIARPPNAASRFAACK